MKAFPNLLEAVVDALERIFWKKEKADRVVQEVLKSNPKWGSRDRRFIADHIYEVVRWYRLLYEIWGIEPTIERERSNWYGVLAVLWVRQEKDWPSFAPFDQINRAIIEKKFTTPLPFPIEASYPAWLDKYGRAQLGEKWESTALKLNEPQAVYLRVNSIKATLKDVELALKKEDIPFERINAGALRLAARKNFQQLKAFKAGWFEIQDLGSQAISDFLEVQPNSLVIDACAGAGGKSLQLAAAMKNTGKIIAMDIHAVKLNALKERAYRSGVQNINTLLIDDQFNLGVYSNRADFVLVDAPCSGSGVIRRQPDTKWKLTAEDLLQIQNNQKQILSNYAQFVKPGGTLVYATCSIFPSENEEQVHTFLSSDAGTAFELLKDFTLLPQDKDTDGFYMAKILRKV